MSSFNFREWTSGQGYVDANSEIRSHSSALFNERLHGMFLMYEIEIVDCEISPNIKRVIKSKALLSSIWRSIRSTVALDKVTQKICQVETKHEGIYTPDVGFAHIEECLTEIMRTQDYSYPKMMYIVNNIKQIENIIREIMQRYKYFIRINADMKPDISIASEKFNKMADEKTVNEFKILTGDKHNITRGTTEYEVDEKVLYEVAKSLETDEDLEDEYEDTIDDENEVNENETKRLE